MMEYRIGQTFPLTRGRGIQHPPDISPLWFAILTPPQKESAARAFLRSKDVWAFYPSEERSRPRPGGRPGKITWERPIVGGYVFAKFSQTPQWHVLRAHDKLFRGVMCIGDRPYPIGSATIRHLQGLTVEAKKLEAEQEAAVRAQREAVKARAGERAVFAEGPLKGFFVNVVEVTGGEAVFEFLTGGRGRADLYALERIPHAKSG